MVNKDMEDPPQNRENQREKFNQFMGRLAEDPVLRNAATASRLSLAEILNEAKYPVNQEFQKDYGLQQFVPMEPKPAIDAALLLTLLFQEKGLNCTSDDLVRHVLDGGSVEQFMQQAFGGRKE